MMLLAHGLPIEVRIAQKAGVRVLFTILLRIGGALLLGFLLLKLYSTGNFLTENNNALWKPQAVMDDSLLSWGINQIKVLFQVLGVISVLVIFLKLLKLSGLEKILQIVLKPFLVLLGLSEKTVSISIIGLTLGLTYGGGLLINEAKKGSITKLDILGSLSLVALCHSLIEDTLLIMLLGADLSGILYLRVLFSLFVVAIFVRILKKFHDKNVLKYFVYSA